MPTVRTRLGSVIYDGLCILPDVPEFENPVSPPTVNEIPPEALRTSDPISAPDTSSLIVARLEMLNYNGVSALQIVIDSMTYELADQDFLLSGAVPPWDTSSDTTVPYIIQWPGNPYDEAFLRSLDVKGVVSDVYGNTVTFDLSGTVS